MLQTPRLHLEPLSQQHLSAFHEIYSNPIATHYSPRGPSTSLADSSSLLSDLIGHQNPLGLIYAVLLPCQSTQPEKSGNSREDIMISVMGTWLTPLDEDTGERIAEVFYIPHPEYWKNGYATEALRGFVYTFWKQRGEIRTLEASGVGEENVGSLRVVRKCGFKGWGGR
jgi:[ribosomal protein S5]-alanine N-acetyltransferase